MRIISSMLGLATLIAFNVACTASGGDDKDGTDNDTETGDMTGETGGEELELFINEVDPPSCTGSSWTFSAITQEWPQDARLYLAQTAVASPNNWDEEHSMDLGTTTDNPASQVIEVTLGNTGAVGSVKDGTSLFDCGDNGSLTAAMKITDQSGDVVDCVVFGDDPDALINGTYDANTFSPISIDGESFSSCLKADLDF